MLAIHQITPPAAIAARLFSLLQPAHNSEIEAARLFGTVVVLRPVYDQFARHETADTRASREAAFATGLLVIGALASEHGLKLVPCNADGRPTEQEQASGMVIKSRHYDLDSCSYRQREQHNAELDRFLQHSELVGSHMQGVEFDLMVPARPQSVSYQYDPAHIDHCGV